MKNSAILMALLVAGCDQPVKVELKREDAPAAPVGRYIAMPIPGSSIMHEDKGFFESAVWRIDTVSGNLEVCTYTEAPPLFVQGKSHETSSLMCAYSAKVYPVE